MRLACFARVRLLRRGAARAMTTTTSPPAHKGYEAFGSFHTPSTEALFAGHVPPDLPDPASFLPALTPDDLLDARDAARNRTMFTIDFAQWTYLNHGAFGGPTRYASRVAGAWRTFADAQPLLFNDRLLFPFVVQAIQALARVLHVADARELVLLPNATSGLHAVLDSVLGPQATHDAKDHVVVCFSTRYGAVRKMLQTLEAANARLRVHEEPLTLEESYDDDAVLRKLERALDEIGDKARCRLVVVDHITSNTGVLLPVAQIVARCHARGVPVLVDGAHGLFNLPLDLAALDADYYVGNCHKWFAAPKGAAFLHVKAAAAECAPSIRPRVVSHGFFDGFQSAFMWIGLQDYAPWLALPRCIDFWNLQDAARCRTRIHALAQAATERLYEAWDMPDELAQAQEFPLHKRHAMRLVKLPSRRVFGVDCNGAAPNDSGDAKRIQDALHQAHRIEVPVKCVGGALYVRISAHVYNSLEDYERLAEAVWRASD